MKYAGYMPNDFVNGNGVCVSLWASGCPHRCPGCHNQDLWDYNYGEEIPTDLKGQIVKAISANGINRNFSILGGEPLCPENIEWIADVIKAVRVAYPNIKIFLWTGYEYKEIMSMSYNGNNYIDDILHNIDVLIEGRYIESLRDISLPLRGSSNQKVIYLHEVDK